MALDSVLSQEDGGMKYRYQSWLTLIYHFAIVGNTLRENSDEEYLVVVGDHVII